MQDQDFTKDQNSENNRNQESFNASPEVEAPANFTASDEEAEQENVVFSRPAEIPAENRTENQTDAKNMSAGEEELFGRYEIKSWNWTPRIYKIFAFSAIFNILFLIAVAQTDVLRTKACDSPLVGGFCQVIDTLYVGGKVLSTDGSFVDKPYEQTKIDDADVVWVNKDGIEPPLEYPAGYFQIANPEQYLPETNGSIPGITDFPTGVNPSGAVPNPTIVNPTTINPTFPKTTANSVFNRNPRVPKVKGNEIPNDLPDGITVPSTDPNAESKNPTVSKNGKQDAKKDEPNDSKQPEIKSENIADFRPNKVPFKDLAKEVLELQKNQNNAFDLSKNFFVEMSAVLTKEGKFEKEKTRYNPNTTKGDEQMVNLAKNAMEKIGDSQVFYYLKQLGVDKVNFVLEQNDKEIRAVVKATLPSKEKAKTTSSGFNGLMLLADVNVKEDDKDLKTLLKAVKFRPENNDFVIDFNLDKNMAQAMIKEQLVKAEKAAEEEKNNKPNSTAQTADNNNTAK